MRILLVHSFHHPRGGDSTYARGLERLLRAAGHEVVPLAMRHPENDPSPWEARWPGWVDFSETAPLVDRLRTAAGMIWSREAARTCRDLVRDARPDVAHFQHVHRHLTPSVLGPLNDAKIPVVWTVHDYELVCPQGHLFTHGATCERCLGHRYVEAVRNRCKDGGLLPSVAVALEKSVHRFVHVWNRVARFLCPSRFQADVLVRFGVPADRVQHLPNFIDADGIEPARGPGEGWLVAGRLAPEKGVAVAVEAARRLPGHPLLVCGTGPDEAELRRAAADLPHVRFLGHLPPDRLAEAIRSVRAVAVPSVWWENFPFAVTEAQAAARAVVASRTGGIPEQIDDGIDGLLVPPGDALALARAVRSLLDDPARAVAIGAAGRARVLTRLSPADHLARMLDVYRSVLARSGPRP